MKYRVIVNTDKCGEPSDCALCIEVCPQNVFISRPLRKGPPGVRSVPARMIIVQHPEKCDGCLLCVEECPEGSIEVKPLFSEAVKS